MKNKILLASLFLAFNFSLSAQEYNKQYSVKATTWLESKLDFPSSPYQITIKTLGENSNKRFSGGVNLGATYLGGLTTGLSLNFRFGKERFIDFGKKKQWRLLYGLDYLVGASANISSLWNIVGVKGGIAPFAGLQYRITKRLVIYTETNYELSLTGFASNRAARISLNSGLVPLGSIWLGFELYKPKKK